MHVRRWIAQRPQTHRAQLLECPMLMLHLSGTSKVKGSLKSSRETEFSLLCLTATGIGVSICSARKLFIIWGAHCMKYRVLLYDFYKPILNFTVKAHKNIFSTLFCSVMNGCGFFLLSLTVTFWHWADCPKETSPHTSPFLHSRNAFPVFYLTITHSQFPCELHRS